MSEFKTTLPLPIDELLKLLPEGAAIHPRDGIALTADKKSVEVTWYADRLKTNASRAVEYSIEALRGQGDPPRELIEETRAVKVQNEEVAPEAVKVRKLKK